MPDSPKRPSNWREALDATDLETVRLMLLLAYEYLDATGTRMTARELMDAMQHPV